MTPEDSENTAKHQQVSAKAVKGPLKAVSHWPRTSSVRHACVKRKNEINGIILTVFTLQASVTRHTHAYVFLSLWDPFLTRDAWLYAQRALVRMATFPVCRSIKQ